MVHDQTTRERPSRRIRASEALRDELDDWADGLPYTWEAALDSVPDDLLRHLRAAADLWFLHSIAPHPLDPRIRGCFPTTWNRFLWAAEQAFFDSAAANPPPPVMPAAPSVEPGAHVVYRAYAPDGVLLYVGVTRSFTDRMRAHERSPWWDSCDEILVETFETRVEAERAERQAIHKELPAFNRSGRQR